MVNKLVLKGYFFLIVLLNYTLLNAQLNNQNSFNKITVEDGLSNSVVYKILQDNDGFLWFTTKDGLNKFDGVNITKYAPDDDSYQIAADNIVLDITQSPTSPIYCAAASGGIYVFNKEKDKFEKLNIKGINPIISSVYDLYLTDDNKLIIASASGLFYLNISTLEIKYINNISQITQSVFKDNSDKYWVGTNEGLYYGNISFDSLNVKSDLQLLEPFNESVVFCFNQDTLNRIWIGTRRNGLYVSDKNQTNFINLNKKLINQFGDLASIKDIEIHEGKIFIALDGNGICIFDYDLNIIQTYLHIDDVTHSLSNNGVYDIAFNSNNTMWIATYGGGVNSLRRNKNGFIKIQHEPYNKNSIRNNTARSFIETDDGKYWFGTKKGLSIFDKSTNKWRHLGLNKIDEENVIVLNICKSYGNNHVWVGTYKHGLIKVDSRNYQYEKIKLQNENREKVGTDFIYSVVEDKKGRIWTGGIFGALSLYDPKSNITKDLGINNVKTIFESSWGKVYVGTTLGLYEIDLNSLEVQRPKPYNVLLNQNRIFSILGEENSQEKKLWLGTEGGGLILWNVSQQTIKVYSIKDGLPSNFVYGIEKDDYGFLWLSTTNGLVKLNPQLNEIVSFNYSDGLSDQEFNFGAHGKTKQGALVFGGQHGFVYFNPKETKMDSTLPNIVFNSFKLFGKEQLIDYENSVLTKHINSTFSINLKHKQNSINIGFSAIDYVNPKKIKYSWMLNGFDARWSDPSTNREAIYTNIKPGNYTFLVKASNHEGLWGENTRSLAIIINPPFTQTVWAYIIYAFLIIGIIFLIMHYNRIRVNERSANEKTRFFVNIAHDLRTPLTLVKAPLEQLSISKEINIGDKGSLLLARKNVDLLNRLVTQLMDFQKADLDKMQFLPAPYLFIDFLKETCSSFQPLIDEKQIKMNLVFPDNDFKLWFDKNKMEKIIFNLLSNAIKYTNNKGEITIKVSENKDSCVISFKDNGVGIPADQQRSIFTRYFRANNVINSQETGSGVGLMLVKKLVELHGGDITFESIEGKGTSFKVEIPNKTHKIEKTAITNDSDKLQLEVFKTNAVNDENIDFAHKKNTYRVLLVEDNKELLYYVSGLLEKYFEVLTAENGKIGLEIAKEKHPDLIISDIMMPIMDGNQMCNLLKSNINTCHIPVVLLTALNTLDYKIEGLKVGADAYVEKPFDVSYLMAQINNLLATRQKLKEKFALFSESEVKVLPFNSMDNELLESAKAFILKNISNNELSVELLAKELCMSRPVLYRKIKALTDQSPQDFIRLIRLLEAKKLLMDSKNNISDAAYETGFSDPKYFSTSFKKQFGVTPSQFMKGDNN